MERGKEGIRINYGESLTKRGEDRFCRVKKNTMKATAENF